MNKMQKRTLAKVLKVIFYLLGFPLLLVLVAKDSMPYFDETMYDGKAATGIWVVAIMWLAITLIQIGLYLVMKKQQALRTIIVIVLALVIMLAPFAAMDKKNEQKIEDLQAEYAGKGVTINSYSLQKQHYVTLYEDLVSYTDATLNQVNDFISVYGLKGYYPYVYRKHTQLNTTIYYVTPDGTRYDDYDAFDSIEDQSPLAFNQNGLLADNYVFGVENAVDLLIKYNNYSALTVYRPVNTSRYTDSTAKAEAIANKWYIINTDGKYVRFKDGDATDGVTFYESLAIADAYAQMVSELEDGTYDYADADISWDDYVNDNYEITDTRTGEKTTYSVLKEEADKYVLTEQRLNDVLQVVFEYLGAAPGLNDLIDELNLDAILNLVSALLTADESDLDGGAIGTVVSELLYGYKGQTTGIALPAQYLFGNLTFKESTKIKTKVGDTPSDGDMVFTITYKYDNKQKKNVATLAYQAYDSSTMYTSYSTKVLNKDTNVYDDVDVLCKDNFPALKNADNIYVDGSLIDLNAGVTFTTGETYTETSIITAYESYEESLKANYSGTTDGGFDYTAIAALTDLIKSLQPALSLVGSLLDGDTVMGLLGGLVEGLDLETILGAILKDGALDAVVADLLNGIDLTTITPEGVQDLLMGILGDISYYQHPLLKKCWQEDFLSSADKALVATDGTIVNMGEYAWNKYACEDFGVANGCALIAKGGLLSGTTLGTDTPADEAFTQAELYQLQADISYQPDMYPLLSARRYINMWYGMIVVSIFFSTYFYNKEKRYEYEALVLDGGEY